MYVNLCYVSVLRLSEGESLISRDSLVMYYVEYMIAYYVSMSLGSERNARAPIYRMKKEMLFLFLLCAGARLRSGV